MAKISVTTEQGILVQRIDTREFDLLKPYGRACLWEGIVEAINRADKMDEAERQARN